MISGANLKKKISFLLLVELKLSVPYLGAPTVGQGLW